MRNANTLSLRLSALAAVLLSAVGLSACGGGAATERPEQLVVDLRPPLAPPPAPPVVPPAPPLPPEPPAVPASEVDLALVRAMAEVPANPIAAEDPETYAGLYVGGDTGILFRRAGGTWRRIDALVGTVVEGMAYVAPRHALYIVTRDVVGCRLGRLFLSPAVFPRFEWLSGGLDGTVLGSRNLTGLAFDERAGILYASDSVLQAVFRFATLDTGMAVPEAVSLGFADLQDIAYDARNDRLVLLDRDLSAAIDLDHHVWTTLRTAPLSFADLRALTCEQAGTRLVVDRATAALIRFDEAGSVLP